MTRCLAKSGAALLAALMWPASPLQADGERVRDCMSPAQAREILIQQKLIAPFRAFAEAQRAEQAEGVGLQLCRLGDLFVYDVTLLRRDGRVNHSLVNARTGGLVGSPRLHR